MPTKEDEQRWDEELKRIPIDRIRPPRYKLRNINPLLPEYCYDLENIRAAGILHPILVSYEGEDNNGAWYECIDGWKRTTVFKHLRYSEIDAKIRHNVTDQERKFWSIQGQDNQYKTSDIEYAQQLRRIIEVENITQTELAMRLGWSVPKVTEVLRLTTLCDEVQRALNNGEITLSAASVLARVQPYEQADFLESAKKLSFRDFRSLISEHAQNRAVSKRQARMSSSQFEEFVPSPHRRRWDSVRNEIAMQHVAKRVAPSLSPVEAFTEGLRWSFKLDKETVDKQRKHFEARKKRQQDEYRRRMGTDM